MLAFSIIFPRQILTQCSRVVSYITTLTLSPLSQWLRYPDTPLGWSVQVLKCCYLVCERKSFYPVGAKIGSREVQAPGGDRLRICEACEAADS